MSTVVISTRIGAGAGLFMALVVVGASTVMERSVSAIGAHFHLADLIVGGVILAAVTSLPNAVGAVFLALRGRGAAVLSEAMNSNMLNVLVGLLLPGIFIGLGGTGGGATLVAAWYVCLTVFSLALAYLGRGLGRRQGYAIVAGYLAFVVAAVSGKAALRIGAGEETAQARPPPKCSPTRRYRQRPRMRRDPRALHP